MRRDEHEGFVDDQVLRARMLMDYDEKRAQELLRRSAKHLLSVSHTNVAGPRA
jgi:hypothetical protein